MEAPSKRKVTVKVDFNNIINRPPPRSVSPFKPLHGPSSVISEPPLRPKAKVNSSATVINRKVSGSSSTVTPVVRAPPASAIPRPNSPSKRPVSPYKPLHGHSREISSTRSAVDGPTSKPKAALTAHALSRQRSMTATPSDAAFLTSVRARRGSGSFHPAEVRSASPSRSLLSPDSASASAGPVRVKAKLSGLARTNGLSSAPSTPSNLSGPTSPLYATTRATHSRTRAPSIPDFGAISNPPSPTIPSSPLAYPITTGAPNANPHRYAPPSLNSSPSSGRFQSFTAHSNHPGVTFSANYHLTPKVDPASIPLPPQSPPASTLSFSSRSSQSSASQTPSSITSGSTVSTLNSHVNGLAAPEIIHDLSAKVNPPQPTALDALVDLFDPSSRRESGASVASSAWERETQRPDPDRKIRAEAKSNRKIEDLEITNRSLLAINSSLEATRHRQAKEIHELRRKLRESRLILPPRAFRAVKSSLRPEDIADDEDVEDDDDNDDDHEEVESIGTGKHDETYRRVRGLLDSLLESGRKALAATPDDFREGGKVLSAEEVLSWRGSDDASDVRSMQDPGEVTFSTDMDSEDEADGRRRPLTPSRVAVPDGDDDDLRSEDEVEAMTSPYIPSARHVPPITVTLS